MYYSVRSVRSTWQLGSRRAVRWQLAPDALLLGRHCFHAACGVQPVFGGVFVRRTPSSQRNVNERLNTGSRMASSAAKAAPAAQQAGGAASRTSVCGACSFDTSRLAVREWHTPSSDDWEAHKLSAAVVDIMTEPVTRALPPDWKGPFSVERAEAWVLERDAEGPTLLVVEKETGKPAGLVILFEMPAESAGDDSGGESKAAASSAVDVRLGYMLAEHAWGKGLGSELVSGLVEWCRGQPGLRSLTGGVERSNVASRRILEKCGFVEVVEEKPAGDATASAAEHGGAEGEGEQLFTLLLHGST